MTRRTCLALLAALVVPRRVSTHADESYVRGILYQTEVPFTVNYIAAPEITHPFTADVILKIARATGIPPSVLVADGREMRGSS